MQHAGFDSEWVTVGQHRVLLKCRGTFPDDHMRFVARVAAEACDNSSRAARVVSICHDDPDGCYDILVASTERADSRLEDILITVLHTLFNSGGYSPEVRIVKKGDERSDHYDHAAHLSKEAGIAAGRGR